jgi:uncharacterized protein (PEP-CTERM system associated)
MAITDTVMALKNRTLLTAALLTIYSPITWANEWQFEPTVRVNETYSDNVNLDNNGKTSSFVNQLGLGADAIYKSNNTTLDLQAEALRATYSHNSDLDDLFLTLNSNVKVKLGSSGLSLLGTASIENRPQNSYINPYADLISGETTQFEQYSAGLGYNVRNSKYTISSSLLLNRSSSEDGFGEQHGYSASISSQNGTHSKNIFWDVNASYSERNNNNRTGRSNTTELKVGYISAYKFTPFVRLYQEDNSGSVGSARFAESDSFGVGFRWLVIPRLKVDLSYNFPSDESSDNNQDDYYDVNVNWQPTQRTTLTAGLSQRFYGDSYDFSLSHKTRRLTNRISYEESIQTFTRDSFSVVNQGFFWCPNSASVATFDVCVSDTTGLDLNEYSIRPILDFQIIEDDSFSLNKNWSWLSSLAFKRTTLTFTANKTERLNLSDNVKSKVDRVNFKVSRKISGFSTVDLSTLYTKNHNSIGLDTEVLSQHRRYTIDYNRKLNRTLSFTLGLSHQNSHSIQAFFTYKENRISLELNKVL